MSLYYIHRVGSQEMGSVERYGKPQRGRYFLISKECLEFFPHLSSVALNDKAPVFIVPTYVDTRLKVLCTIDYHNQKHSLFNYAGNNPRDEVRLYMNQKIDPDLYFKTDDLAIFEKFDVKDEIIYSLTRVRPTEEGYDFLIQYLSENARKPYCSNAILNGEIQFIKKPDIENDMQIEVSDDAEKYINDASNDILMHEDDDVLIDEQQMGAELFNSVTFRQFVLLAYDNRCAITRNVICYGNLCNLEAAHIKPQAHNGKFLPCNGIAMSRDMHFAFDKGFFTIDRDYKVQVASQLKGSDFYKEYNGVQIFVPQVEYFRPHKVFLDYHREHIFQTFSQIRQQQFVSVANENIPYNQQKEPLRKAAEPAATYGRNTQMKFEL